MLLKLLRAADSHPERPELFQACWPSSVQPVDYMVSIVTTADAICGHDSINIIQLMCAPSPNVF